MTATVKVIPTYQFARNLQAGDLIIVPYTNRLYPAIFTGYGKAGNVRFYTLHVGQPYRNNIIERITVKHKKPYVSFINRTGQNIIAKLDPDELESSYRQWYEEFKGLLLKHNMI